MPEEPIDKPAEHAEDCSGCEICGETEESDNETDSYVSPVPATPQQQAEDSLPAQKDPSISFKETPTGCDADMTRQLASTTNRPPSDDDIRDIHDYVRGLTSTHEHEHEHDSKPDPKPAPEIEGNK